MGFIDDLAAAKNIKPRRMACSIAVVFGALDADEAKALTAALADEGITHVAISSVLRDNGHDISPITVSRHRRRECRCER